MTKELMSVSGWWPDCWPEPDAIAEAAIWESLETDIRAEMDKRGLEKEKCALVRQISHDDDENVTIYKLTLSPYEGGKEYKA